MPLRDAPRRRWLAGLLVVLPAMLALAVWLQWGRGEALARIRRAGVVRIGYAVEKPYAFLAPDGRVTGESPETARLVAARLGWRIEWVQTSFEALIPDLLDGRFDLVAAGMFVTPQRARVVRFAAPELQVGAGLLVRPDNPRAPRGLADLQARPGLRAAVVAGSVEEQRLRDRGVPGLLAVPDARAGAAAVESGLVDALVLSLPTVRAFARGHRRLAAMPAVGDEPVNHVASAFRPEDRSLLAAWNRAQAPVLASAQRLRAIAAFGFTAQDVPQPPDPASAGGT